MLAKLCSRSQGQPPFGSRRRAMISTSRKIGCVAAASSGMAWNPRIEGRIDQAAPTATSQVETATLASPSPGGSMRAPRLFHFSDDPAIAVFTPRPVRVPAERGPGREWLNGPLVWAIDEPRQPMYLFPRDCPRILLWLTPQTTEADKALWWG